MTKCRDCDPIEAARQTGYMAGQASRDDEFAELRQQLTEREKYVKLLRDAIHDGCLCIAQYWEQPPDCLLEALAATEPKP